MQKPSIGRIVVYNELARGPELEPVPAIIQHVHADGSVRLWAFGAFSTTVVDYVLQGAGPGYWSWPPRVE